MSVATRSARFGLRATPQQEIVLRRAAEVSNKSMTDFILDSAYKAAEQTLLDQPERDNPGLKGLLSRRAPWNT